MRDVSTHCLGLDAHADWFTQEQANLSPIAHRCVSKQISINDPVHNNMCTLGY